MTKTIYATFDGKTLVPERPTDLPEGKRLRLVVDDDSDNAPKPTVYGLALNSAMDEARKLISPEALDAIERRYKESRREFADESDSTEGKA